jgi:hypothetical protein
MRTNYHDRRSRDSVRASLYAQASSFFGEVALMLSKLMLAMLLVGAVSCSSSSGDDDDGPTGPVIDSFTAPTTATLQTDTNGNRGWPIPMIISFHDDTENVKGIDFSAQGGNNVPVTFAPEQQVKQATNYQTGVTLLYTPNAAGTFKSGTTVDYAVSLLGASGAYGKAATGTVTLQ